MKINHGKIFLFPLYFFILIINPACSDSSRHSDPVEVSKADTAGKIFKPPSSFSDTLKISLPSAVFYNPDSIQLEKIKKITEKDVIESEVHNCFYLMRNARNVLKKYWPRIHIIETSRHSHLLFIREDQHPVLVDLNNKGDMCGIFLFDGKKDPELVDMMNIDTALGFYFGK